MGVQSVSLGPVLGPNPAALHLLSVVIPAHNEEGCIFSTVEHLHLELRLQKIPHEIVVVDDGSTDSTWAALQELSQHITVLKPVQNRGPHGFGRAVAEGFACMSGDAVVIMDSDMQDPPDLLPEMVRLFRQGYDVVSPQRISTSAS